MKELEKEVENFIKGMMKKEGLKTIKEQGNYNKIKEQISNITNEEMASCIICATNIGNVMYGTEAEILATFGCIVSELKEKIPKELLKSVFEEALNKDFKKNITSDKDITSNLDELNEALDKLMKLMEK